MSDKNTPTLLDAAKENLTYGIKLATSIGRKYIDPSERKVANQIIGSLTQGTLVGQQGWTEDADGAFQTRLGIWNVRVHAGQIIIFSKLAPAYIGTHNLAATQTGRLLNMYLTVDGALDSDKALRKQMFALSEDEPSEQA